MGLTPSVLGGVKRDMFRITREINFSYAHRLIHYQGKCANLHGHNARVLVEVSSEKLNHQGMVMDFCEIREVVEKWINQNLDHKTILCADDPLTEVLQKSGEPIVVIKENPTAEVLAKWIFEEARKARLPVSRVTLWETEDSAATYHE